MTPTETKSLVESLQIISQDTAERLNSMVDTYGEELEATTQEAMLANLLGGSMSCSASTQSLIQTLKILGVRFQNLKTIMVDLLGMTDFNYGHIFSIESAGDAGEVVYRCKTHPIDLSEVSRYIKYQYNIPFVVNTVTGVDYECVITPDDTAENSASIGDIKSCLVFLSNSVNEMCTMLIKYVE